MLLIIIATYACTNDYTGDNRIKMTGVDVQVDLPNVGNAEEENDIDVLDIAISKKTVISETPDNINNNIISLDMDLEAVSAESSNEHSDISGTDTEIKIDVPMVDADIESTIRDIDDRVDWIMERLWNDAYMRTEYTALDYFSRTEAKDYEDLYNGETIIFRTGNEYSDKLEGEIIYEIYYNEDGCMIYAEVIQYRYLSYSIYFNNDEFVCLITGERTNEKEKTLDEFMTNAVRLCLENAYF